jgi:hypothetical protein
VNLSVTTLMRSMAERINKARWARTLERRLVMGKRKGAPYKKNPKYHLVSSGPKKKMTRAPRERKGPKGIRIR